MAFQYEDLDDSQFERLIVECARKLFGTGVQEFAAGPDGGRDARFEGTAEMFPSSNAPWEGITVFQAKHTIAINAHYADKDFSGDSASAVLTQEIPRIKKLVDEKEVDNYFLASNRRLGGVSAPRIKKRIAEETGLPSPRIYLVGIEYLDNMLHRHRDLLNLARIDPIDGPLVVSSFDLAEVMLAIAEQLQAPLPEFDAAVVDRVSYDEKNDLNGMTPKFSQHLMRKYLVYADEIEDFLARPENALSLEYYRASVDEFQEKIIANRKDYQSFDKVFNHLADLLRSRNGILASNAKLLKAVLFYMYWNCDIGEVVDADANEVLKA